MPKYYAYMIAGYYLYFTSKCIVEAFHVHASDKRLSEESLLDPGSMRSTSEPSAGQRRPRRPHAVLACMRSPSSRFLRLAVAMASMTSWYSAEGWIRLCRGTTMSEHLR